MRELSEIYISIEDIPAMAPLIKDLYEKKENLGRLLSTVMWFKIQIQPEVKTQDTITVSLGTNEKEWQDAVNKAIKGVKEVEKDLLRLREINFATDKENSNDN